MQGRVLIVTGSTGIGAAAARSAVGRGARLLIAAADEDTCRELARAALFLLGEAPASMTGQVLYVDGGWSVLAG